MKCLSPHDNIISLLGCVTKSGNSTLTFALGTFTLLTSLAWLRVYLQNRYPQWSAFKLCHVTEKVIGPRPD